MTRARVLPALALLLAPVAARALPFTPYFDGLRDEVQARDDALANPSTKEEVRRKKALGKALAALAAPSESLREDCVHAATVARALEPVYPGDEVLGPLLLGMNAGLSGEIAFATAGRGDVYLGFPEGPVRRAAEARARRIQALLTAADEDPAAAPRAKGNLRAAKALRSLSIYLDTHDGYGGGNLIRMVIGGEIWRAGAPYVLFDPGPGTFTLQGTRLEDGTVLTFTVLAGITGPGTYPLPQGAGFWSRPGAGPGSFYGLTGGSLTIEELDAAAGVVRGTFSFTTVNGQGGTIAAEKGRFGSTRAVGP